MPIPAELITNSNGTWWPASAALAVPFILLRNVLRRSAAGQINWRAAVLTVVIFECLMIVAEHYSLSRGHWVYNKARLLGPKIWGVPIEEPLIYYWLGPFFTITLWGAVRHHLKKNQMAERGVHDTDFT